MLQSTVTAWRRGHPPRAPAFCLAASAGGAVNAIKTTPLMTMEEGMEAMRKAGGSGYRPPSS